MLSSGSSPRHMAVLFLGALSALGMTSARSVEDKNRSRLARDIGWEGDFKSWFSKAAENKLVEISGYKFHSGPPTPIEVPTCDMENGDCSMEKIKSNANTAIYPGKNTQCLNSSTPYYFQVMPGKGKGLLIYFAGGGACWMDGTNALGSCYGDEVIASVSPEVVQAPYHGVFDKSNSKNPFADYTIISISYCSGDVHVGDNSRTYDNIVKGEAPVVVRQAGKDNTMATLEWVKENIPQPEQIVVMGCSAGSIGAQLWGGFIADMYADNDCPPVTSVVADSYTGVFPASQAKMFEVYSISRAPFTHVLPAPLLNKVKAGTIYLCEMIDALHQVYPDISYLSVQSKADVIQTMFYDAIAHTLGDGPEVMKGDAPQCALNSIPAPRRLLTPEGFYDGVLGMYDSFAKPNNFAPYLVNSMYHCYTCFDRFYTTEIKVTGLSGNTKSITLTSWLEQAKLPNAGVETDLTARCEIGAYHVGGSWWQALMFEIFTKCPANF